MYLSKIRKQSVSFMLLIHKGPPEGSPLCKLNPSLVDNVYSATSMLYASIFLILLV